MSRPSRFTGDPATLRLTLTLGLNVLFIGVVIALRFMLPISFQRPALSIPNMGDFSIANWFANRLADLVSLIQELLRHLIQ